MMVLRPAMLATALALGDRVVGFCAQCFLFLGCCFKTEVKGKLRGGGGEVVEEEVEKLG